MRCLALVLTCALAPPAFAAADGGPADAKVAQEIRAVLDAQVAAWNHGDLTGFMTGYWASPDLTFFSGGTETRGHEATLERYRKRYKGAGRKMGRLGFSDLVVEPLGDAAAFVRGRFHLSLLTGDQDGLFTLIFRKLPEGWRIVHDHSSVDPSPPTPAPDASSH
jgi:beta-aspartyl-peptidase (threonine type)